MAALSSEVVTSEIVNVGPASSSVIVNIPVASLIDALLAFDKPKVIVSSPSKVLSSVIVTLIEPEEEPADIVRVHDVAV